MVDDAHKDESFQEIASKGLWHQAAIVLTNPKSRNVYAFESILMSNNIFRENQSYLIFLEQGKN
jgi:hypothetical protein